MARKRNVFKDYGHRFKGWGLENRLAQMFNIDSGRTVLLAVDHGYFQGAPKGLKNLKKTIKPLLPYCDAISPCIGGLDEIDPKIRTPIILRATGGNSMTRPDDLDDEIITLSPEKIINSNALGFTVSCYIGMPHQKQSIQNLTKLINETSEYGLIPIGITAVGKGIIKTYYCNGFEKLVRSCLSPVIIAGGTKQPTKNALDFTYNAIQAGAVGVDMGRNIFQDKYPVAMIKAVRSIVHKDKTSDEAYEFYNELIKKK